MSQWVSRQLESTVSASGRLHLAVGEARLPDPGPDEVIVRIEAAPINPTDLAILLASAPATGFVANAAGAEAAIPDRAMKLHRGRVDKPVVAGYEGAGTVVAAGDSDAAQSLVGRVVALAAGNMFSEYRCVAASEVMAMEPGTTPREAASSVVNPMTVLGFLETLRLEDHKAMVHTAAASNLGQMLNRVCLEEGVGLVNVVRSPEQRELLVEQGAEYVVDASQEDFRTRLTDAIAATGATLAFDAVGGGRLGNTILSCMERAAARGTRTSHYGTEVFKQLYIYGRLDLAPTELTAAYGFAWSVGGWLMGQFLRRTEPARVEALRGRIVRDIKTTFASDYAAEVSLEEAMNPEAIARYGSLSTGNKYLINPGAQR